MNRDEEQLRLLSIFHFVAAGIAGFVACFPIIHLVVGIAITAGTFTGQPGQAEVPAFVGILFIVIASFIIIAGWSLAAVMVITGRFLGQRSHYTFCMAVAAVECIFMPIGTVLGVFTIIVLNRDSVQAIFEQASSSPPE